MNFLFSLLLFIVVIMPIIAKLLLLCVKLLIIIVIVLLLLLLLFLLSHIIIIIIFYYYASLISPPSVVPWVCRYPVILSLEVHCGLEGQVAMAKIVREVLGAAGMKKSHIIMIFLFAFVCMYVLGVGVCAWVCVRGSQQQLANFKLNLLSI